MRERTEYSELQRRCKVILRDLGIHRSLTLDAVRERVEEFRGRPLILKELPEPMATAGACGLWLGTDDADYVFYEARTAPLHQQHIILHELAHVLCDHGGSPDSGGLPASPLLGDLQPRLVKRLMARTSYTTMEEQEAEMIASLIQSAGKPRRSAGRLGRLSAYLGVTADDRD
ncbi:regulator component [Streptomyces beigongshangae]|uniref:regulator component n=1 Tax=Streptomyces beigongshangae TaxID=2841597 RepID=UPI001C8513DE|nr:regulator component [Streptomyces sp. REN17]